jgi:hypothetical protein
MRRLHFVFAPSKLGALKPKAAGMTQVRETDPHVAT